MKKLLALLALTYIAYGAQAQTQSDFSLDQKAVMVEAIGRYVYFEDEGYERYPANIADFSFELNDGVIIASGRSFSDWDDKEIDYYCEIRIESLESMQSENIDLWCELEGENWPHL